MTITGHILGFPRIGSNRELKKSLEEYWKNKIQKQDLLKIGKEIRQKSWEQQKNSGLDFISVGDFSWYDHVLDTSVMVNNIPERHRINHPQCDVDTLFRISRGYHIDDNLIEPSAMKKWFNTNYHYIVPEFTKNQKFQLNWTQLFDQIDEALSLNYKVKPIILGPISYLWLGKTQNKLFDKLSLLPSLISVYQKILHILSQKNILWIQIDEPILVLELPIQWAKAYLNTYQQLNNSRKKVKILLTTYFDSIYHHINIINQLKVDGLHVDLVSNPDDILLLHQKLPKCWVLSAGIVDGRNIWKTNLYDWFKKLIPIIKQRKFWIGSSCSLLHSPIDLNIEYSLNEDLKKWLAFSVQKCHEIHMLCTSLNEYIKNNSEKIQDKLITHYIDSEFKNYLKKFNDIEISYLIKNIHNIPHNRTESYQIRSALQNKTLNLPLYPTTTIGSFPQTKEIRSLRTQLKLKKIDKKNYESKIKQYIYHIISEQEKLGLDILVHGEPERNDMVEYFGENLNGFIFTQNGWVQSYGSRCVKPPIIFGDISRPYPITIKWIKYAQSLTKKPVKGILTGPITMLSWSFIRKDISPEIIALQLALAIRKEILDLEKSGINIIQIDEPALREGLPLKLSKHNQYLNWAIKSFKLTVSSIKNSTQIHTHMCYSEFDDIIDAIIELDTDVISIEASRSEEKFLNTIQKLINNGINAIGPGIYDIHSPHIPTTNYIVDKLKKYLKHIPNKLLWINPDCGLKTRSWDEIQKALKNMILASKILRSIQQE